MLKPHLLLTILIFALIGGVAAHYAAQGRFSWPSPVSVPPHIPNASPSSNTSPAPSPSKTSEPPGGSATMPDIGPKGPPANNPIRLPGDGGTAGGNRGDWGGDSGGWNGNGQGGNDDSDNGRSAGNDRGGYGGGQNVPGQFDYYALVLSWSPTYCAEKGDRADESQCDSGRPYAFVLHGLWPQYERGWPSECQLDRRPFVPDPVISRMLDIMPSRGLVIHEYRTHGTCSGLDPERYFETAHRLFNGITIPERFRNPQQAQSVSPGDVRDAFLKANPKFSAGMIGVVCGSGRLKEVRLCLAKDGRPRACGDNESPRKLCNANQVSVPPTR